MRYCKDIAKLLFWNLWECLTIPIKTLLLICRKLFKHLCMQKINFITHFYGKILQRNRKLVIFGNLSMLDHTSKMIVSIWKNLWKIWKIWRSLSAAKKSTSSFTFSLRYWKDIANFFIFGYFEQAWVHTHKIIVSTCRKYQC